MSSTFAEADSRMSAIETKLSAFESSRGRKTDEQGTDACNDAVLDYQTQLLQRLRSVRDALAADGGDIGSIKEERDALKAENTRLKKDAEKLNYRVQHLVKSLNEAEEARS